VYPAEAKLIFCRRLANSWRELCDVVEIPSHERVAYISGEEGRAIWEWLEHRGRLTELAAALRQIGRSDLADETDRRSKLAQPDSPSLLAKGTDGAEPLTSPKYPKPMILAGRARLARERYTSRHRLSGRAVEKPLSHSRPSRAALVVLGLIVLSVSASDSSARNPKSPSVMPMIHPSPSRTAPVISPSLMSPTPRGTSAPAGIDMVARANFVKEDEQKANLVRIDSNVRCYLVAVKSLLLHRYVAVEESDEPERDRVLRARSQSVAGPWEKLTLCDDLAAHVTSIRNYKNFYVTAEHEVSGKVSDALHASAKELVVTAQFEWLGGFRGGVSTFRALRSGRYVGVVGEGASREGNLRALSKNVGSAERFEVSLLTSTDPRENTRAWPLDSQVRDGFDSVLSRMRGAAQLDDTSVQVAEGVVLRVWTPVGASGFELFGRLCPFASVCLFEDGSWNNNSASRDGRPRYSLQFTSCPAEWDLGDIPHPDGGGWNDRATSIINNMSRPKWAYFLRIHRRSRLSADLRRTLVEYSGRFGSCAVADSRPSRQRQYRRHPYLWERPGVLGGQ